jgi:hypothetical protein
MIAVCSFPHQFDAVPHAIFWRPLAYFTMEIRKEVDDLDEFEGASFQIGNQISFDLRKYAGHPDFTASVYLPMQMEDPREINEVLDRVIKEFRLPKSAIGWRRGWDFSPGSVPRDQTDRLREPEARILFLKIAALQPRCRVTTTFVKSEVRRFYPLSPADRKPSLTRRKEQLWQQIVGNVIVHKYPFTQGYAVPAPGGLRLKTEGLNYLKSIGFAPLSTTCD